LSYLRDNPQFAHLSLKTLAENGPASFLKNNFLEHRGQLPTPIRTSSQAFTQINARPIHEGEMKTLEAIEMGIKTIATIAVLLIRIAF
jgi:hypothetical protein